MGNWLATVPGKGYFAILRVTDRPKPPSTRVGADMTTVASLTSYVSPEQRFVTCTNQPNNRKKRT